jgi:cardiolipin synthase A/B
MLPMALKLKRVIWTVPVTVILTVITVALAMNFRTPNTLAHKLEHKYAISDPQFRREMGVLLGPAITSGNRVTDLENGEQIFPAMLHAIHSAQKTITFETYIYWSGEIGKKFSDAFAERARIGVKVNITIDWHGGAKLDKTQLEEMKQAGVHVVLYRPLRWYNVSRLNNRTHRKLLVVDGSVGFTGGVGIADAWEGRAQDPDHWRDMHFRIEGPVVAQLQAAFNDNWIKTTGEVLNGADYFPALTPIGSTDANVFMSSPTGGSESMHLMYLMVVAATEHSIDLSAAYFIPDDLITQALLAARQRGVRIRILMPGKHTDSEAVRLASKATWGPLLAAGVEMYEYQPTMVHNKLLIADNAMVSVGSTNFDIRSFQLNDEASLNVYDQTFSTHMTTVFEEDLRNAKPYTYDMWKSRSWEEKAAEKFLVPIKSQL